MLNGTLTRRELLAFGLGGLMTLVGLNTGVAQARLVPSGSMAPTFQEGDRMLVVAHTAPVKRGDVLVFKPPFRGLPGVGVFEEAPYVKRCVALGGDMVEVKAGKGLWVNGRAVAEPYVLEKARYSWGPARVPAGQLCMLGDNRNDSFDSHYWGFLPQTRVVGRPGALIWPPRRWRAF